MSGSLPSASTESLKPFFHPRTVAVIGASRNQAAIGHRLVESLRGSRFGGAIIPVNPYAAEIAGLRVAPSLSAISGPVDLAVIAVPPQVVASVIDDCGSKKVPAVVLITAGYAESGDVGISLEQQLRAQVRRQGMRLLGPNCFGLMNLDPAVRLNATYTPVVPPYGRVAVASESGGIGIAIVTAAGRLNLGLSSFVSVGNHADVSVNDLIEYWEQDRATDVILLYLETIVEPHRFREIAGRVGRVKPIVVLKAGQTAAGQSAAGSHTAALATNETAVDALFTQCGLIRAKTLDDLFALAVGLSSQPRPSGRRVGILTNSGGPGVLCADSCAAEGLIVPALPARTQAALGSFLPRTAALKNPVDMIGFATEEQHARAVETMLNEDGLDAVIIVHVSVRAADNPPVAAGIMRGVRAARQVGVTRKPVFLSWMAEGDLDRSFIVDGETIPTYSRAETPAAVLRQTLAYDAWRQRPVGSVTAFADADLRRAGTICAKALAERGAGWLTAGEIDAVGMAAKLPFVSGSVARTADEAVKAARAIGFPVAVKAASRRIVHKTESGAVHLSLTNEQDVREAYDAIRRRLVQDGSLDAMEEVLVQAMVSDGVEAVIGMSRDPLFGALIAFGLGGIHVEVLRDVQFRLAPLTDRDAAEMVRDIKGHRVLAGYRGKPQVDIPALEEALLRLSCLVAAVPEISELDFNPIFALADGRGCKIADARIRVGPASG